MVPVSAESLEFDSVEADVCVSHATVNYSRNAFLFLSVGGSTSRLSLLSCLIVLFVLTTAFKDQTRHVLNSMMGYISLPAILQKIMQVGRPCYC